MTGIEQAIHDAGSEAKLAELLGCTQQAVNLWKQRGYVPAQRVDQIANAFRIERNALIDPAVLALVKGK